MPHKPFLPGRVVPYGGVQSTLAACGLVTGSSRRGMAHAMEMDVVTIPKNGLPVRAMLGLLHELCKTGIAAKACEDRALLV